MKRAILYAALIGVIGCSSTPSEPDAHLVFDNQSASVITVAGFSDCEDLSGFGPNLLKSDLQPGSRVSFGAKAGCWDLEVVFADGFKLHEWSVTLETGETWTWQIRR